MRAVRMRVPPEFMQPRPLPWNPDPFGPGAFGPAYPPGFIGGDYDRNPDFMGMFMYDFIQLDTSRNDQSCLNFKTCKVKTC